MLGAAHETWYIVTNPGYALREMEGGVDLLQFVLHTDEITESQ